MRDSLFLLRYSKSRISVSGVSAIPGFSGHTLDISLAKNGSEPDQSVRVQFPVFKYKKKESCCHYYLSGTKTHIFVLGMVFLNDEQRAAINSQPREKIDEDHIPELYLQGGMAELQKLWGEFNIVVVDAEKAEVFCLSSHFGMLPLYYSESEDRIFVSNNLQALGKSSGYHDFNQAVLAQLCLYNYSLTDETLLFSCYSMPPGTLLHYKLGHLELTRYWSPDALFTKKVETGNNAVDMIDEAFGNAVKQYTDQVEQTAISLTGGWDGRLILSYAMELLSPENIRLYSFGTADSPDVIIPSHISARLSLDYHPYILDQRYLDNSYPGVAAATAVFSDGYRSIQRSHYLYAMQDLSSDYSSLISGNCGSNVMKAAATTPSVVMNARILQILSSDNPESIVLTHLQELKSALYPEFEDLQPDVFLGSVFSLELKRALSQSQYSHRVSCFVLGILERKYFGPELASYQHLIGNFSPFINLGFINVLAKTEYFNAFRESSGIFGNRSNAVLYAKLMWRHNKELSRFASDKHIKLSDLLHPLGFPVVAAKQIYRRKIQKHLKQINPYNTGDTLQRFIKAFPKLNCQSFPVLTDKNMLGAYITASYWYKSSFSNYL